MDHEPLASTPSVPDGRVYVLRIWEEPSVGSVGWRASVREGPRGERSYFASIDECLEYLYTEFLRR
ncbi:hypothetical protein [Deinococcus apachensis]|uniref:hypothetical protein n=1 Tax=Deinococcus apachensis TaxID=309886 RepID=UPI00037AC3E6|nr:hypothetical protein [Deinococcus apachensis]